MAQPNPVQVWSHSTATHGFVEVYLSDGALEAATAAFVHPLVAGARRGEALPSGCALTSGCALIIGGQRTPAWGLADAERRLSQSDLSEMPLHERLKADLLRAMKARQRTTVATLRSMLAAIDNAGAVEPNTSTSPVVGRSADVSRKVLTEEQMRKVLQTEVEERRSAVAEYERLERHVEADRLRAELEVFAHYLADSALNTALGTRRSTSNHPEDRRC